MAAITAEATRSAVIALLTPALIGLGKPAQIVIDGLTDDFGGVVPAVMIADAGTQRRARELTGTKYRSFFRFAILVWVSDANAAEGWTDALAANQISQIDAAIADTLAANRRTAAWNYIGHTEDYTEIEPIADKGGRSYLVATIQVVAEVFDA